MEDWEWNKKISVHGGVPKAQATEMQQAGENIRAGHKGASLGARSRGSQGIFQHKV